MNWLFVKQPILQSSVNSWKSFLGHIEILSDEEIATFTEQYQQAEQNYQQLEQQKHVLDKQQQWFERKAKLEQEVQAKQQQF